MTSFRLILFSKKVSETKLSSFLIGVVLVLKAVWQGLTSSIFNIKFPVDTESFAIQLMVITLFKKFILC